VASPGSGQGAGREPEIEETAPGLQSRA